MKPLNRKLIRDMKSLKIQIFSMSLLVACGTAILIASWSAYTSLSKAKDLYYSEYSFADIFADVVRAPNLILEKIQSLQGVADAEGRIITNGLIHLEDQAEPALGYVISISPKMKINKIHLRSGRWPQPGPAKEVLIHESFATAHRLQAGDTFYINIKAQKTKINISGIAISPEYIYTLSPLAPFPDDRHFGVMWMLKSQLEELTGLQGAFNNIIIKSKSGALLEQIKQDVDQLLKPFGTVGAYDRSLQVSHILIQDEINQQKSMSFVAPGIFILVATFILHTVLHRLINLQRLQIATLKSLGYPSLVIAYHYWKLVSVILLFGLTLGYLFAYAIGQWYTVLYRQFFRFPDIQFTISSIAFFLGVAASFIPGGFVTFFALRSLFNLQPAEAMRPVTSSRFSISRGLVWLPLLKSSTTSKMILRNILARPWRATFSILGLAAAVAILINGGFWSDVVNFLVDRQFRKSNREDLEVRFLHPRKPNVISELYQIPGVKIVETARVVGVTLIFRNIRKSTTISAVSENSQLRRLFTTKGTLIHLDESVILLSNFFKNHYDLHIGDRVQLEITDKTRPAFFAVIGGFVDDLVGASIYAKKSDLHHWLHEEPSIDSVYLKVDPSQSKNIYVRLKESPEVIAVQVKKLVLESFNKILLNMITTFTMILVGFAATITGAVLFNLSRISLSERSWELASMKIMGFQNSELFQVLFLEIGVLLLFALIPGFILGYYLSYLSTHLIHSETLSFPLVIMPATYALAAMVLIVSYLVIGIFIYHNIINLNMTEALKARE